MLLDVGLQHCVEVLELSVSDQTYDVYLSGREGKKSESVTSLCLAVNIYKAGMKLCAVI